MTAGADELQRNSTTLHGTVASFAMKRLLKRSLPIIIIHLPFLP